MRIFNLLLTSAILLGAAQVSHGLGYEKFGPIAPPLVTQQPGWPTGMVEIVGHKSRVYSMWVNGSENFHFNASKKQIAELILLYSKANLREHVLTIKEGKGSARTFHQGEIECNVSYFFLGGIARFSSRRKDEPLTFEPTLTVHLNSETDREWWNKLTIPENIIVNTEIQDWPVNGKSTKLKRKLWYAKVMFDESHPAADFENNISTRVTLWKKDRKEGFYLGKIRHDGQFKVALSKEEVAGLKSGDHWITLSVGNHRTVVSKEHTKFDIAQMSTDRSKAKAVVIPRVKPMAFWQVH